MKTGLKVDGRNKRVKFDILDGDDYKESFSMGRGAVRCLKSVATFRSSYSFHLYVSGVSEAWKNGVHVWGLKTGIAAVKGGWRECNVEKEVGERDRAGMRMKYVYWL